MSDNLGPGAYATSQLSKDTLIAAKNDLTFQLLMNSETQQFSYMQSSNTISDIEQHYSKEIQLVRNEMKGLDDKTSNEYYDLMAEVQELESERDEKVKQEESKRTDFQKRYDTQKTSIETRLESVKSDLEGIKQMQDSNIKRNS